LSLRGIYESAAFVMGKKHSMNTKYELAMIKPVLPETLCAVVLESLDATPLIRGW
jgi:hypothetical protein